MCYLCCKGWQEAWAVQFTEAGLIAAQSSNMPEELLREACALVILRAFSSFRVRSVRSACAQFVPRALSSFRVRLVRSACAQFVPRAFSLFHARSACSTRAQLVPRALSLFHARSLCPAYALLAVPAYSCSRILMLNEHHKILIIKGKVLQKIIAFQNCLYDVKLGSY